MTDYVVFFQAMTEEQREELNASCWSSPIGRAYLEAEPIVDDKAPVYAGAIEFDLFERAAFVRECSDREQLFYRMQNRGPNWACEPTVKAYADFPRSMSVGDIVYEPATDEWSYVARFGFKPIEDEAFIEYLQAKIDWSELAKLTEHVRRCAPR